METAPHRDPGRPDNLRNHLLAFRAFVRLFYSFSWPATINHVSLASLWPQKLQRLRWCVRLAALSNSELYSSPIHNDTGLHPHLFKPRSRKGYDSFSLPYKINCKLTRAPSTYLLLVRDCCHFTDIPQAPLRCPAHLGPAKCPTDDRRPGALPLCPKE
jgi:hypothetical protein